MKRIICMIAAIVTMLIYCAAPLMVHAESLDLNNSEYFYSYEQLENTRLPVQENERYFEFQFFEFSSSGFYGNTFGFRFVEDYYQHNVTVTSVGTMTTITFVGNRDAMLCYKSYGCSDLDTDTMTASSCSFQDFWSDDGTRDRSSYPSFNRIVIDSSNSSIRFFRSDNSEYKSGCKLYDVKTNFDDFFFGNALDLSVSFSPALTGSISRKSVIDGKEYTSNTLDLCISNNGKNAQFSWFIVPKGQNVTFPTSLLESNQGFDGNPTFAYVKDEWTGFQVAGLQGNSLYSPSAWHTIPKGYKNQYYHVAWSQMYLAADKEYDVVVYACLNELNDVSDKQVDGNLSNVMEIYRSTFSITDPAEFSPDSDGFGVHPWNPNIDNTGLFNVSSGYKDNDGNIVIRGQTRKGGYVIGSGYLDDIYSQRNSINVNNYFGSFFGFFRSIFSYFPSAFVSIITMGLITIVIVAIIKKVT